jgi:hypothetical protein
MENFVGMELAPQLTWAEQRGRLYNYRTLANQPAT